jgi:hypothetical protein
MVLRDPGCVYPPSAAGLLHYRIHQRDDAMHMVRHYNEYICPGVQMVLWQLSPGCFDNADHFWFDEQHLTAIGADRHEIRAFGSVVVSR